MRRLIPGRWRHWEYLAGVLVALLWLAMALHGASRLGPVIDETAHFGDGLAILGHGDFRMNPEHPPLFKVLAVLPAWLFLRPNLEVQMGNAVVGSWVDAEQNPWGHYLLYLAGNDPHRLLLACRLVPILTGLLGGLLAWWWGARLGGRRAGLLAMTLLLFYPEYMGHARYVTLDVPTLVACAALAALFRKWWSSPSAGGMVVYALAAGILALVKLPVVFFIMAQWLAGLALLAVPLLRGPRLRVYLLLTLLLIASGVLCQWAASGFRFSLMSETVPMERPQRLLVFETYRDAPLPNAIRWIHAHRLLPETTLCVLSHVSTIEGRHQFLLDEVSFQGGWYHYFLVTILIKTPFIHLAGLCLAAWIVGRRWLRGRAPARARLAMFLVPFGVLFVLAVLARLNIGHRHILHVYFPWTVLMGVLLARWTLAGGWRVIAGWGLPAIAVAACLWAQPNQATYFNVIAGGSPWRASGWLRDSNIDWGQDIVAAGEAVRELGYTKVNLAYFGHARPQAYGIADFNFILPGYPYVSYMPAAVPPDPALPTVVSLHPLPDVRQLYPGRFDREPIRICNSIVIFAPEVSSPVP